MLAKQLFNGSAVAAGIKACAAYVDPQKLSLRDPEGVSQ